jgi:hypothetical protein
MGFAQAGVVAGEGKAVTSDRPRAGEKKGCDAPGSIDPAAGENGCWGAERRSVQRSRLRCSVPGMPVVGKAGNRITWNHFFCGRSVHGLNHARLGIVPRRSGPVRVISMAPRQPIQSDNMLDSAFRLGEEYFRAGSFCGY